MSPINMHESLAYLAHFDNHFLNESIINGFDVQNELKVNIIKPLNRHIQVITDAVQQPHYLNDIDPKEIHDAAKMVKSFQGQLPTYAIEEIRPLLETAYGVLQTAEKVFVKLPVPSESRLRTSLRWATSAVGGFINSVTSVSYLVAENGLELFSQGRNQIYDFATQAYIEAMFYRDPKKREIIKAIDDLLSEDQVVNQEMTKKLIELMLKDAGFRDNLKLLIDSVIDVRDKPSVNPSYKPLFDAFRATLDSKILTNDDYSSLKPFLLFLAETALPGMLTLCTDNLEKVYLEKVLQKYENDLMGEKIDDGSTVKELLLGLKINTDLEDVGKNSAGTSVELEKQFSIDLMRVDGIKINGKVIYKLDIGEPAKIYEKIETELGAQVAKKLQRILTQSILANKAMGYPTVQRDLGELRSIYQLFFANYFEYDVTTTNDNKIVAKINTAFKLMSTHSSKLIMAYIPAQVTITVDKDDLLADKSAYQTLKVVNNNGAIHWVNDLGPEFAYELAILSIAPNSVVFEILPL